MGTELLAAGAADVCAHCGAALAGAAAWWDEQHRDWTCTTCVPADDGATHSLAYGVHRRAIMPRRKRQ
jgi:hypothetical protein